MIFEPGIAYLQIALNKQSRFQCLRAKSGTLHVQEGK